MRSLLALFGANPRKAANGQEQSLAAGSVAAPAGNRDLPIQSSASDASKPSNGTQQRCASQGNANQGLSALFSAPPGATFNGPARNAPAQAAACMQRNAATVVRSLRHRMRMPKPRATQAQNALLMMRAAAAVLMSAQAPTRRPTLAASMPAVLTSTTLTHLPVEHPTTRCMHRLPCMPPHRCMRSPRRLPTS